MNSYGGTHRCKTAAAGSHVVSSKPNSHFYVPPSEMLKILYLSERHLSTRKTPQILPGFSSFFVHIQQNPVCPVFLPFPPPLRLPIPVGRGPASAAFPSRGIGVSAHFISRSAQRMATPHVRGAASGANGIPRPWGGGWIRLPRPARFCRRQEPWTAPEHRSTRRSRRSPPPR